MIMSNGVIGLHNEYLSNEDFAMVKESMWETMGDLSLECYKIGFLRVPEDVTLEELQKQFKDVVQIKLDQLAPLPTSTVMGQ